MYSIDLEVPNLKQNEEVHFVIPSNTYPKSKLRDLSEDSSFHF